MSKGKAILITFIVFVVIGLVALGIVYAITYPPYKKGAEKLCPVENPPDGGLVPDCPPTMRPCGTTRGVCVSPVTGFIYHTWYNPKTDRCDLNPERTYYLGNSSGVQNISQGGVRLWKVADSDPKCPKAIQEINPVRTLKDQAKRFSRR